MTEQLASCAVGAHVTWAGLEWRGQERGLFLKPGGFLESLQIAISDEVRGVRPVLAVLGEEENGERAGITRSRGELRIGHLSRT